MLTFVRTVWRRVRHWELASWMADLDSEICVLCGSKSVELGSDDDVRCLDCGFHVNEAKAGPHGPAVEELLRVAFAHRQLTCADRSLYRSMQPPSFWWVPGQRMVKTPAERAEYLADAQACFQCAWDALGNLPAERELLARSRTVPSGRNVGEFSPMMTLDLGILAAVRVQDLRRDFAKVIEQLEGMLDGRRHALREALRQSPT
jgi:hypothetical protein